MVRDAHHRFFFERCAAACAAVFARFFAQPASHAAALIAARDERGARLRQAFSFAAASQQAATPRRLMPRFADVEAADYGSAVRRRYACSYGCQRALKLPLAATPMRRTAPTPPRCSDTAVLQMLRASFFADDAVATRAARPFAPPAALPQR